MSFLPLMPSIYKKTVDAIVESGNHYVIQVKRNQLKLWRGLMDMLQMSSPIDEFMATERAKGTQHTWLTEVYDVSHSQLVGDWKDTKRLILTGKVSGDEKNSLRLFISDLSMTEAEKYYQGIRGHWSIENQLHRQATLWPKDVYHKEDENGITHPNGAVNSSVVGSIALNLHRKNGRKKIKKAQMVANAKFKQMIEEIRT